MIDPSAKKTDLTLIFVTKNGHQFMNPFNIFEAYFGNAAESSIFPFCLMPAKLRQDADVSTVVVICINSVFRS